MKKLIILILITGFFACEPRQGKVVNEVPAAASESNLKEVEVKEVLQANSYTYVRAAENGNDIWMAILKSDIEVGKKYYYDQAMEMKNFTSKDLDRTFESVYFLEGLYDNPNDFTKMGVTAPNDQLHGKKEEASKKDIHIPSEEGVKSIAFLYENKKDLESQKVVVKGIVTKYNPNIMSKNWVHIQDGTGGESTYDLTITTLDEVQPGQIVKFEGVVTVDKDFGHGYQYDLLLEEATQLDKHIEGKLN